MITVQWRLWFWWVLATTAGWAVVGFIPTGLTFSSDIIVSGFLRVAVGGILAGLLQWLVLRRKIARSFLWIVACVVAAVVVAVVVFIIGEVSQDIAWVVGVGAYGLFLGELQWVVLRPQVGRAGWWVLACTLGWVVAIFLGGFGEWIMLGAAYGGITGLVLRWLLRQDLLEDQAAE